MKTSCVFAGHATVYPVLWWIPRTWSHLLAIYHPNCSTDQKVWPVATNSTVEQPREPFSDSNGWDLMRGSIKWSHLLAIYHPNCSTDQKVWAGATNSTVEQPREPYSDSNGWDLMRGSNFAGTTLSNMRVQVTGHPDGGRWSIVLLAYLHYFEKYTTKNKKRKRITHYKRSSDRVFR